jgi:arabinan endo-1,5-alpha-L-arabinosidase
MILRSPGDIPFRFTIVISEAAGSSVCTFEITADVTTAKKTFFYQVENSNHHSWLSLFEKLSKDFGLRLPVNKQEEKKYSFDIPWRELLTKNLVPEMLYGYGDPAVLRVEEENEIWYYLVTTSNDAPHSFPICRSRNLTDWEFVNFIFPKGNKPGWAADGEFTSDYWAPEMHKVGDEFRVYFVARDKNTLELCIGMARSSKPGGPFVPDAEPILNGDKIDPHVFVEEDNSVFLYWKEDNNVLWPSRLIEILYDHSQLIDHLFTVKQDRVTASFIITLWPWIQTLKPMEAFMVEQVFIEAVTTVFPVFKERLREVANEDTAMQNDILSLLELMTTPVYAQKLSADGSSLVGIKKLIMENDQPWEAHLVEGMWLTKHDDKYYLFYSGNDFSTEEYGIGVAMANSPLGPFAKMPGPILRSTKKWRAPGHPSVAVGPDGKNYLFMHAYFPGKAGYKEFRALLAVPIRFEKDKVLII